MAGIHAEVSYIHNRFKAAKRRLNGCERRWHMNEEAPRGAEPAAGCKNGRRAR